MAAKNGMKLMCGGLSSSEAGATGQEATQEEAVHDSEAAPQRLFRGPRDLEATAAKYMCSFKEAEETDTSIKRSRSLHHSHSHVSTGLHSSLCYPTWTCTISSICSPCIRTFSARAQRDFHIAHDLQNPAHLQHPAQHQKELKQNVCSP